LSTCYTSRVLYTAELSGVIDEDTQDVAGIYALTFTRLKREALGAFQSKGIKDGPPLIPAYFIGQFAVAKAYQKQGLAGGLVKDIFQFLLEQAERGIPAPLIYLLHNSRQQAFGATWDSLFAQNLA
jgi:GNAT superfamily N-acetyltransferase